MRKKILLCDDDEGVVEVVKIVLAEKGYAVEVLYECGEIDKQVKKIKPDLIILDLWIPEIGGEQATRVLKADPATRNIPIIILSAHHDTEKLAKAVGADAFLKKPFDITVLENIVGKHLR